MSIEKKIETIKKNKDEAISAINFYLDTLYNMTDKYFDENNNLIEGLEHDEKVEDFIKSMRQDTIQYENVRRKLINNDFNLSLVDIAYIGLSFLFMGTVTGKRIEVLIKELTERQKFFKSISENLMENETQNVDFSKK